ncbi:hypothetical protein BC936DRAFT_141523 [Jimgerdemannia flammicorona]|uniref:Nucleoporin protein Ndc1-Nup n=1 Tax=Jimgerdemannia flammicorona TaxID=994334 RepID=A0A433DG28_9FUNG|nr:hypothetical protein BC936DRAFT_141523 [Jimgerdemannia flammicorona]
MPPPHPLRPHAVPTVAYFRACQSSLNRRIIDVAAVLLLFVYGLVLLFQARLGIFGNIYNIVSFKTIFYTITIYVPLALLVIARKALMTVERSVQPSLLMSIFAHLADARTWTLLGLYMLSGLVIGVSYFSMHGEKYVKSVFLYPEGKHGAAQLSEQIIFIVLHNLGLGAAYGIYHLVQERYYLRFPVIQQTQSWAIKGRLPTVAANSARFAGYAFAAAYVVFFFFGRMIYRYQAGFLGYFITILRSPVIRFRWFDFHLFFRTFLNGMFAATCWELVDQIFDVFFTEPTYVSDEVADSNGCLASGLKLADKPYFRALAFLELWNISKYNKQRRTILFCDILSAPTAWQQVSCECMKVVNELTVELENEFKKPEEGSSNGTLPVPDSRPTQHTTGGNKLSAVSTNIFLTKNKTSLLDKLKDPAPPPRIDAAAGSSASEAVPNIFRKSERAPSLQPDNFLFESPPRQQPTSLLTEEAKRQGVEYTKKQLHDAVVLLKGHLEGRAWGRILLANTIERRTRHLFRNLQVQIWAIEALSCLTAASYREDEYGSVQRDIPKVIECLLACLMAIEAYLQRPPLGPGAGGIKTNPHQMLMREPHAVVQGTFLCDSFGRGL